MIISMRENALSIKLLLPSIRFFFFFLFLFSFSFAHEIESVVSNNTNRNEFERLKKSERRNLEELCGFLAIDSTSAVADNKEGVEEARRYVEAKMIDIGFKDIKTYDLSSFDSKAHSVMVAVGIFPTKTNDEIEDEAFDETLIPTVMFYNHYDVQPGENSELWENSVVFPKTLDQCFEYTNDDDDDVSKVKGRGASDNKGNLWAVLSSIEAYNTNEKGKSTNNNKPVRIVLLQEGQEEIGSVGMDKWMKKYAKKYFNNNIDAAFSADGSTGDYNRNGVITLGLRGGTDVEIHVRNGADADLHSGSFGGAIVNPIQALAAIMASFHDPITGRILVDGYYEDIHTFTNEEIGLLKKDFPTDKEFSKTAGNGASLYGECNYTTAERIGIRPTIEFVGIYGGYAGEGIKTVLPDYASVKIVSRLAPGQNPQKCFKLIQKHIKRVSLKLAPSAIVSTSGGSFSNEPFLGKYDSVSNIIAKKVLTDTYGVQPKVAYEGGSIPVMRMIQKYASIEPALMAFSTKDNMFHSPNEWYSKEQFVTATRSYVRVLSEVSEIEKKGRSELELEIRRNARNVKKAVENGFIEAKSRIDPQLAVARESVRKGYDTFVSMIRHITGKHD